MARIVLDAMGSDQHPEPELKAAVEAARENGETVFVAGPEDLLRQKLDGEGSDLVEIVHAPEVFKMTDQLSPDELKRAKSSMAIGMDLVKRGEADAFVTMGNTGGAMGNGLIRLGRIRGVKRPALTALFPVRDGRCVVLDIGANVTCKPSYLVQFAQMGAVYAESVLGVRSPRVGLLSNGEEAGKGNDLVKETYPLLKESRLNFIGNVEGKELFAGEADVVVTDGFTGNVLLKSSEAVAKLLTDVLRESMMQSTLTKIGGMLARPAFAGVRSMLDPAEVGAVPLLGIDGLVFVGHGRSQSRAVLSALRLARQSVSVGLLESLRNEIEKGIKKQ